MNEEYKFLNHKHQYTKKKKLAIMTITVAIVYSRLYRPLEFSIEKNMPDKIAERTLIFEMYSRLYNSMFLYGSMKTSNSLPEITTKVETIDLKNRDSEIKMALKLSSIIFFKMIVKSQ